jgi:hypothetical protein
MKRSNGILVIVCVLFILVIFSKHIILFAARKIIETTCVHSTVRIGGCSLKPTRLLRFYDIDIKNGQLYDFNIKELTIHFTFLSLLKRVISGVEIAQLSSRVDLGQKTFSQLGSYLNLKTQHGLLRIDTLQISNSTLDLKAGDLILIAKGTLDFNLRRQLLTSLQLDIDFLQSNAIELDKAILRISQDKPKGEFYINTLKFETLKIMDIRSMITLSDNVLTLLSLSARILGGTIEGDARIRVGKTPEYSCNLKAKDVSLETIVKDFNLGEKIRMTGSVSGHAALEGRWPRIDAVNGNLSTAAPGGIFSISDTKFLETIARTTKQSLEMIVESFRDYRYNEGTIGLSMEGKDLVVSVFLNGQAGKRNLNVILHDFMVWESIKHFPNH